MGSEHWEVNGRDQPSVSGRFFTHLRMIDDIANQEADRRDQGYDHAHHVCPPCAAPDEVPTHRDEDGAHQVKRGVKSR